MTVEELIKKWKISQKAIAEKADIPVHEFKKKISHIPYYEFKPEQKAKILAVLKDLAAEIKQTKDFDEV